jgi:uncharacterized protein
MKIDLRQVTPEGNDFHFTEKADEMEISTEGVKFPYPIEADISAMLSGDEVICQGEVFTTLEIECSRCLDLFDYEVNTRLQFVIQMLDGTVDFEDEDYDDYEVIPKTQTVFDISQRVKDAIILSIPLKPLCSEDCKGLCPMCGANLNEGQCDCTPDKTDERWDALKNLFDEQVD